MSVRHPRVSGQIRSEDDFSSALYSDACQESSHILMRGVTSRRSLPLQTPQRRALKQESSRTEPALKLTAETARELWARIARGALERRVVLEAMRSRDDAFVRRVRWERNTFLRIRAAFETLVLARKPGIRIGVEPCDDELPDEIGLALFSAHLLRQVERLHFESIGPRSPDSEEAQARLPVFRGVRDLFHEALGVDPQHVRARAQALPLADDPRAAPRALHLHGVEIRSENEAFLAPDEELARVAAALAELS